MRRNHLLSCLFVFSAFSVCFSQSQKNSYTYQEKPPEESGKCFAECIMPDQFEKIVDKYYTLKEDAFSKDVNIDTLILEIKPADSVFIIEKANDNCRPCADDHRMIWCLEDRPAILDTILVIDTAITKDYSVYSVIRNKLIKKGGYREWRQVVCEDDLSPQLYEAILLQLGKLGYDIEELGGFSATLRRYQEENRFPIGNFDFETLSSLKIRMEY